MSKHSVESLKAMKLPELRELAKSSGIAVAGKRPADLVREIMKSQGKGKPAAAAKGKAGKAPAAEEAAEESSDGRMQAVVDAVVALLEFCGLDVPEELSGKKAKPSKGKGRKKAEEPEEEDEEDEEAEDEDEEEEGEEEDSEADEEPEEEDEDEEGVEISAEEVAEAKLPRLQEIATLINEQLGEDMLDADCKSAKKLRADIQAVLEENADKDVDEEEEEEEEEDEEEDEAPAKPSWLKKGARVKAKYDGTWYLGKITTIGEGEATVLFDEDGEECDIEFSDLKKSAK